NTDALVTSNPTGLVHIPHGHILPNGIYVTSPKFQFLVRDEFGLLTPIYNIGVQEDEKRQSYVLLIRKAQNLSPEIMPAIEKLLEVPTLEFKDVLLGYAKRLMLTYESGEKHHSYCTLASRYRNKYRYYGSCLSTKILTSG
ncbi:MAG: hypothetical protein UZ20_WS6002000001, partial [candidate division WS6 bacterium OLB21]